MKNIVVAVDFDEEVNDVIEIAASLATNSDAELSVVHIFQPEPESPPLTPYVYSGTADRGLVENPDVHEKILQSEKKRVRELVGDLHKKGVKAAGYMKPADGSIPDSILAFARKQASDLLIIGTHRPGRIERWVVGSNAEAVIRKSTIPVLVVPRSEEKTH